jgi:hypothetical protein
VLVLHKVRFGDWLAYVRFNQGHNGILRFDPFFELFDGASGDSLLYHMSAVSLFGIFAVGAILVFPVSVPLALFGTVYVLFVSIIFHLDLFRYALPGYVFALFIGFDEVWSARATQRALIVLLPLYAALATWYTIGQIASNAAAPWFTEQVLATPVEWF